MTTTNGQVGDVVEPMFHRGILSLPDAASAASVPPAHFRRLARAGRLPFRVRRASGWWEVDEGTFRDWLHTQREELAASS